MIKPTIEATRALAVALAEELDAESQFRTSDSIVEIAKALVTAQAKFEKPKRDKTADMGTYKYTYADLAAVIDAIRKPLTDAGIAVMQAPTSGDDEDLRKVVVTTRLLHASGEWIECSMSARAASETPQAIGSAISYLRRYMLSAMTGIATEEDDDGAAAERKRKRREPPAPAKSKQSQEVEAAALKLRAELLKRTTSKSAAAALLASITKPGIRNVSAFETLEAIDQAWARLEELAEVSMMPQAKEAESAPAVVASSPEPDQEASDGSDNKLFS